MIKGIDVTLYERTMTGVDDFGKKQYSETPVTIHNVLVEPLTSDDIVNNTSLYGKKGTYRLCIPKGDTHEWEDCKIAFFGETWRAFGFVTEYIEKNLPLQWNKKVQVERYG